MKIIRNNVIFSGIEKKDLIYNSPLAQLLKKLKKQIAKTTIIWIEDDLSPYGVKRGME